MSMMMMMMNRVLDFICMPSTSGLHAKGQGASLH
jgi:hypothetical protein